MARAVMVHQQMQARVLSGSIPIVIAAAYEGWGRVAARFQPRSAPMR